MLNIKKKVAVALTTTAIGTMLIGAGTYGIFTSTASNTGNTFASGTLNINLDKPEGCKYFNISNMAPGDTDHVNVVVTNTGTLDLRYDIAETLTGDLANGPDSNGLKITIKDDHGNIIVPSTNNNRILRAVPPGKTETLTVEYNLPLAAGNWYQQKSAVLGLTFNAEQVKNNPVS